jgi:hypothetical protein
MDLPARSWRTMAQLPGPLCIVSLALICSAAFTGCRAEANEDSRRNPDADTNYGANTNPRDRFDAGQHATLGDPIHRQPRMCAEKPHGWIRRPLPGPNSGPVCGSDACDTDDAGVTARCVDDIRLNVPTCLLEDCYSDADCTSSETCLCGTETQVSRCVQANCRSDADCFDFACSPTYACVDKKYGYWGYYCHTTYDRCTSDADCSHTTDSFCGYDLDQKLWRCQRQTCFGRQT